MRPAPCAWIPIGVLLLASAARVTPAAAQPSGAPPPATPASPGREATREKAREHFQQGQRLFKVSRYREALEQFKEAFVAFEDPVFLFNVAQCHRLLGENAEAVLFYRRYLEAAPAAPQRARVNKWIAELEATAPGPSRTGLAPPPVTVSPPPASGAAAPVRLNQAPAEAEPSSAITLTSPPPGPAPDRPIYKRWWFWAGVGAAAILGAVAIGAAAKNRPVTCGSGIARCEQL
jgi:tetratricopeptide (TPR) repeat protein